MLYKRSSSALRDGRQLSITRSSFSASLPSRSVMAHAAAGSRAPVSMRSSSPAFTHRVRQRRSIGGDAAALTAEDGAEPRQLPSLAEGDGVAAAARPIWQRSPEKAAQMPRCARTRAPAVPCSGSGRRRHACTRPAGHRQQPEALNQVREHGLDLDESTPLCSRQSRRSFAIARPNRGVVAFSYD
jgi:hypothetical protein